MTLTGNQHIINHVLVTDCRNESGQLTTAIGAQHGALAATIQPDWTPVAIPPAVGATTSFTLGRYEGSAARWLAARTQIVDKGRCRCFPQVVRKRIRFAQLRHGSLSNEWYANCWFVLTNNTLLIQKTMLCKNIWSKSRHCPLANLFLYCLQEKPYAF